MQPVDILHIKFVLLIKANVMDYTEQEKKRASFGRSYGTGMQVLGDNFWKLLLIVLTVAIIQAPFQIIQITIEIGGFNVFLGIFALFALAYAFLVTPVFQYGQDILFVHAARKQKLEFKTLISGFSENYLHIILANLLVFTIIMIGIIMLIIPGIILGCRLVFVSYLVMDRKLDPIEAVEESWRLTKGHGWTIFFMAFVSFFIIVFGFNLLIIGIFPAIIWVSSAFAVLYQDVLEEKGEYPFEQKNIE